MLIIRNLNLISVQSWTYLSQSHQLLTTVLFKTTLTKIISEEEFSVLLGSSTNK